MAAATRPVGNLRSQLRVNVITDIVHRTYQQSEQTSRAYRLLLKFFSSSVHDITPRIPVSRPFPAGITAMAAILLAAGSYALASPAFTLGSTSGRAPACQPRTLNTSAARAGGSVTVTPAPNSMDASSRSQVSMLGVPPSELSDVSVVGSRSGRHAGHLAAYSQGDGASFLPDSPFAQGELVSVRAVLQRGHSSTPFAWHFTVAYLDSVSRSLETPPPPAPRPKRSEFQRFISAPELRPPTVTVTTDTGMQGTGDLLLAPYAGTGQYGPMILDRDGRLIWFKPLPPGARAADVRLQQYEGAPVITWWQDPLVAAGRSDAGLVIDSTAYRTIMIARAGNGYQPDLHAFEITPAGTALFTVYDAIRCDLTAEHGPAEGAIADTLFQEIDLRTGLVRYEWHSLDHLSLSDSYQPVGSGGTARSPWDDFHINAVSEHGSHFLVDSRNNWAAYWVDARTGQVAWILGGKRSTFTMGPGASPAFQHDVRLDPGGTISFFDNGGTPKVHSQSRGLVVSLDEADHTASLVRSFPHPARPLLAASQGNFQPQGDGEWVAGWGQEPFFSELAPNGASLFDAHLPHGYQSYTVLEFPFSGQPGQPPSIAVRSGPGGGLRVYVSWNGATAVAHWRLLGGARVGALSPLGVANRAGFETHIGLSSRPRFLAAQALGEQGQVLGTSATVAG